jgi:hypothetical protein
MAKNKSRRRNKRRTKKTISRSRRLSGGSLSQEEVNILMSKGLATDQIQILKQFNVSFNEILIKIDQIMEQNPHINSDAMAEQVLLELINEEMFQQNNDSILSQDSFQTQSTVLEDENNHGLNTQSTVLDDEKNHEFDDSFHTQSTVLEEDNNDEFLESQRAGKKSRRSRKNKCSRKSRKQKGGMCYGNGVGANAYDPNYSIFNTNTLKLFPYKP